MPKTDNILLTIMEAQKKAQKANFNWVVSHSETHNRNSCNKALRSLVKKGLLQEEPKAWKRGQGKEYLLTDKGLKQCIRLTFEAIDLCLKNLEHFSGILLSNPDQLHKKAQAVRADVRDIAKAKELTLEEKINRIMKTTDVNFGAFRKALSNMHQISLILLPLSSEIKPIYSSNVYLCVNENGIIEVISADEPIKHPDIKVTSI